MKEDDDKKLENQMNGTTEAKNNGLHMASPLASIVAAAKAKHQR